MHSVRSFRLYYFAAFLLGAVIALLVAAPARAADDGQTVPDELTGPASRSAPDAYS